MLNPTLPRADLLSDWKELMAGSIHPCSPTACQQEMHRVWVWQRPQGPEHLHSQVTAQWHATDSQQKENHLLQRLALENGNDHSGPYGPDKSNFIFHYWALSCSNWSLQKNSRWWTLRFISPFPWWTVFHQVSSPSYLKECCLLETWGCSGWAEVVGARPWSAKSCLSSKETFHLQ